MNAYEIGFIKHCEARGVDPRALVKWAAELEPVGSDAAFKRTLNDTDTVDASGLTRADRDQAAMEQMIRSIRQREGLLRPVPAPSKTLEPSRIIDPRTLTPAQIEASNRSEGIPNPNWAGEVGPTGVSTGAAPVKAVAPKVAPKVAPRVK